MRGCSPRAWRLRLCTRKRQCVCVCMCVCVRACVRACSLPRTKPRKNEAESSIQHTTLKLALPTMLRTRAFPGVLARQAPVLTTQASPSHLFEFQLGSKLPHEAHTQLSLERLVLAFIMSLPVARCFDRGCSSETTAGCQLAACDSFDSSEIDTSTGRQRRGGTRAERERSS